MDELIRQLPHDNQQLESNWPETCNKLHKLSIETPESEQSTFKVKSLNALADYVLADTEKVVQFKLTVIHVTINNLSDGPLPPLDELVRPFCRVLDASNTNNLLHLAFVENIYLRFRLGEHLSENPSVELIDAILVSFQKHQFSDQDCDKETQEQWKQFVAKRLFSSLDCDRNKLNYEKTMLMMRRTFQQLYSWATRNCQQSSVWLEVSYMLARTFPTLFDSFTTSNDAQFHLTACAEPPVSLDYVHLLAESCKRHVDLFTTNSLQIYVVIEKLLAQNKIKEAERFVCNVVVTHFSSISNLEEFIQILTQACPRIDCDLRNSFCKSVVSSISYELAKKKFNKKLAPSFFDLALAVLDLTASEAPANALRIISISEFYPWKQLDKQLTHLIQSCIAYEQITIDSLSGELENLESILKVIIERSKTNPTILRATHTLALQSIFKWSLLINNDTGKPYHKYVYAMGQRMTELVDINQITVDICSELVTNLQKHINNNAETYEVDKVWEFFLHSIARLISESMQQLKTLPTTFHQQLAWYCLSAFNCTLYAENGAMNVEHATALYIWFKLGPCLDNDENARVYGACIDRLFQIIYDEDEPRMYPWWSTFLSFVAIKYPNVAADYAKQLLYEVIDCKKMTLTMLLPGLYAKRPEPFHDRLDDLIHILFGDDNAQNLVCVSSLLDTIVKAHPELITSTQIDYLFSSIKSQIDTSIPMGFIYQILSYIANAQPHLFDKHRQELIDFVTEQQNSQVFNCLQQYLVASTIIHGDKTADEYLTLLIDLVKNTNSISVQLSTQIFHTCQLIGIRHKQILATKRADLLAFEHNTTCRMLIDFIDGNKMSEESQAAINHTLDEMTKIEQRVVHTERDLQSMTKVVKRQELHITNLGARVDVADTRVNDLSEQVDFHAREIERIDAKTLSYVPSEWGRDVCRLLNVRAKNDWRLLGKRFGYSSSELKHWSMQLDPSMSLLNEWFMTHKADEATYGLVKMLHEIGREDVEGIIRKAVQTAGELIPDDLPFDIKRLPPVFLSYQWDSQQAVTRLKTNLEQAGYACWMDTGEMGGGDKLFAKLDAGIRGAKVVICCMNKKYAQSDNCSREVHLTISTGKPLIPLQMEKQSWPPEGALGPIMSEYLFIRFFDRKSNDDNYWPADKFTEILGQIRYHVAPDPDMITPQYHNWFVPRVDNLIFLQPTATATSTPATAVTTTTTTTVATTATDTTKVKPTVKDDTPLAITYPQIMISYQWDNQNDIVILYEKLTKLGYRCWLDIFQMGGGDSLFEKIDTGIRHAKCVLACVTPKYIKSINCRREMALADALEKPIVPLLLEQTTTWPPPGPMAMVFAEKSYVDFQQVKANNERWSGKEFELVLARLQQAVPEVQTEKPQRHLLDMQRPTTAMKREANKAKRIGSAPVTPESRACTIM